MSSNETIAWRIDFLGPYTIDELRNGAVPRHGATGNNIIIQNIMMGDDRNGTVYRCVRIISGIQGDVSRSDPTILYVSGEYQYRVCTTEFIHICIIHIYILSKNL